MFPKVQEILRRTKKPLPEAQPLTDEELKAATGGNTGDLASGVGVGGDTIDPKTDQPKKLDEPT